MTPPLRANTPETPITCRYGTVDDFEIDEFLSGVAAFLGGTANVIMQLSLRPVGYGVMESTVDSGRIDVHPWKRLRTTLTYLAVAMMGTDEDGAAYRAAVDGVHRSVRSEPDAPVEYHAFDPNLQLWVAACLYWGMIDVEQRLHGPLDADTADVLYQYAARLGTTLQMRPDLWPADRTAFQQYWDTNLATRTIDARTRTYLDNLIDLKMVAKPLRIFAPAQRLFVTSLLPRQLRDEMRMSWSPRQERFANLTLRVIGTVHQRLPKQARLFPLNACLYDMRRRHRRGKPLV